MFICRLFHSENPLEQLDARVLTEGVTTVGRDSAANWPVHDPEGVLSRIHMRLVVEAGRLFFCDQSTNGTYLPTGARAVPEQAYELFNRDCLRLGALTLLIDEAAEADEDGTSLSATMVTAAARPMETTLLSLSTVGVRDEDGLIEAFCKGAGLDASAFSSEDSRELMERIGKIYQQTVIGLAGLMAERARLKHEHELERTTISALDNNPFKWTPPRKLAEDLLRGNTAGFLSDVQAVKACFGDLGEHMTGLARAAEAAESHALQILDPEAIDAEAKSQSSLLRSRQAVCWDIMVRRYAELSAAGRTPGSVKLAFSQAYREPAAARA